MSCKISIPVEASLTDMYLKVKNAIESNGGTVTGDENAGTFHLSMMGTIAGSFENTGNLLTIIVEKKPLFISCSQIESILVAKLSGR